MSHKDSSNPSWGEPSLAQPTDYREAGNLCITWACTLATRVVDHTHPIAPSLSSSASSPAALPSDLCNILMADQTAHSKLDDMPIPYASAMLYFFYNISITIPQPSPYLLMRICVLYLITLYLLMRIYFVHTYPGNWSYRHHICPHKQIVLGKVHKSAFLCVRFKKNKKTQKITSKTKQKNNYIVSE